MSTRRLVHRRVKREYDPEVMATLACPIRLAALETSTPSVLDITDGRSP